VVRRVEPVKTGGHALSVIGLSEIVRDKEAVFLTDIEGKSLKTINPVEVDIVADDSPKFRKSHLFVESLLRQTPPTDDKLYVGQHGAMDVLPFQLEPAAQALEQPRQRILIADSVGLGKTIECGILLSELIRRGKAKRILVLAVKSMLTQFQKELWARFSIPLVRLDSLGIQRLRNRIPTNHNPFHYFDKSIISIDTLKNQSEYRTHIENCRWDVIVIDEAHNVALRGSNSLRAKLADLLSLRSDSMLLLSATPHDGKSKSFASLMKMLDATAIADDENYGPDDIKGLYIRRFKMDVKDQIAEAFPEREISIRHARATQVEEDIFDTVANMQFVRLDKHKLSGSMLFKTTLEKTLFSSPWACRATVRTRMRNLEREHGSEHPDLPVLGNLLTQLEAFTKEDFSKYKKLIELIKDRTAGWGWNGKDTHDRLVIFTESIPTAKFLTENLSADLGLKEKQFASLNGSTMSDTEIAQVVEDFGRESSPIRLLIASDVASEGINLHHYSHRLIHFDVPWSLIRFQQRNGRIDRYGQRYKPLINYLLTQSENPKIRGDQRNLEILIEKDKKVVENIGDPTEFTKIHDEGAEELRTAKAMEEGVTGEDFDAQLEADAAAPDPLAKLWGDDEIPVGDDVEEKKSSLPTLFPSDYEFFKDSLAYLENTGETRLQYSCDDVEQSVNFTVPKEFESRLKTLPVEGIPENKAFVLSADRKAVQDEIAHCRKEEKAWPKIQLLWGMHPLLEWANDKLTGSFRRNQAPYVTTGDRLQPGESIFLTFGLIPNLRGQPVIHSWFGLHFHGASFQGRLSLEEVMQKTGFGKESLSNPGSQPDLSQLKNLLPLVVDKAKEIISEDRQKWKDVYDPKLNEELDKLDLLRDKHNAQLELEFAEGQIGAAKRSEKERRSRKTEDIFDEYLKWIEEVMMTEDNPYLRVVAVFGRE
jgi:ERCC4-related helicase